ncbi:hypothetical protein SYNPS1DRAFT_30751 [Syncephalis pseudoplumigaleata]|uniref:Nucleolar protein 12 n=1 Tax=Syncephalis pseudoplumigaleata TaxID=1712513 RepID=A0A4P9YVQ3_9FUNG|nr:hypothetical protein SYNPS1DRAFT_30751 [Syncephalis pseudoplumigaleata]|eukprot:RKP23502.1 hypothetical protein SYNPS1DRAFT_30751 [Syncephalis pseudoplumigaleata]
MTDYVPGQLSSLFTRGSAVNGDTPIVADTANGIATKQNKPRKGKKNKKENKENKEEKDVTAAGQADMNPNVVALFDKSVKATPSQKSIMTTSTTVVEQPAEKQTADEQATGKKRSKKQKKQKTTADHGADEPVKRARKHTSAMEIEDKFEEIVRARALAAMEADEAYRTTPKRDDAMMVDEEDEKEKDEKQPPLDDSDDSSSDGTDVEMDGEEQTSKLKRPRKKDKVQHASRDDDPTRLARTVFVGNVPVAVLDKTEYRTFKRQFAQYGMIESIRFRSIAFSRPLARRIAFVSKQLHKERDTLNAYIVFENEASVTAALAANGTVLLDHHMRVDRATGAQHFDRKRCVFVGNIAFDAQEESLWRHFGDCGRIVNVRMVRDRKSNVGKGFAYVQFEDKSAVALAMRLHESKIGTRTIRVQRCLDTRHKNNAAAAASSQAQKGASTQAFEGERAVRGKPVKLQAKRHKHRPSTKKSK